MTQTAGLHLPDTLVDREPQVLRDKPYSLAAIIGFWALAALPMAFLAWVIVPAIIGHSSVLPAVIYWLAILVGMAWQLVLSLWVLRREGDRLRWTTIRDRAWLGLPRQPRTAKRRLRAFWLVLPLSGVGLVSLTLAVLLTNPTARELIAGRFPVLSWILHFSVPSYALATELASPQYSGQWGMLGLAVVSWLLCAVVGEELLFRGILLPRMGGVFGRCDWVANAFLYSLYHLHKPWMIPSRFIYGLAIAGPAKRWQSTWLAVAIHSAEGLVLVWFVTLGIRVPSSGALPDPLVLPYVHQQPAPYVIFRGAFGALPRYDPNSAANWQVDLRGADLSALDLRSAGSDLAYADFDSHTVWPPSERMPSDFSPLAIAEMGKNPGLGVRQLLSQGITGQGVGIAIIDQPLLTGHEEYTGQLRWYESIRPGNGTSTSMHGPAVASIAVGRSVGVAPAADLYFINSGAGLLTLFTENHDIAHGIRRVLRISQALPADRKLRVISISDGWMPDSAGYDDVMAAVREAQAAGIFVVSSNLQETYGFCMQGLGRDPDGSPDAFTSYGPGLFWAQRFYSNPSQENCLLVPMDSRTTAGPGGQNDYAFYRSGGWSWAIPYIAGSYALAAQVDPQITPERFWALGLETGRTIELERDGNSYKLGRLMDPVALIGKLRAQ